METIFAEATPPGRGGVSVIRISGPEAFGVASALCGSVPQPRQAAVRNLRENGELLDQALVLSFRAGASFTGEDVVEFHLHGAPVIVRRVEAALLRAGCRRAAPGEFTLRAFASGRVDLTEIEGLSDLLAAETELQRVQAMRVAEGELSRKVNSWRESLIEAAALVIAEVDFADEDLGDPMLGQAIEIIDRVRAALSDELSGYEQADRLRQGYEVAIIGAPNSGKSSLLNAFARRDVAIVSDVAGTTRDVIEVRLDLDGLPVTFLDTAGLRETSDAVEGIGISRAVERAKQADLRIGLGDASAFEGILGVDDIAISGKSDIDPKGEFSSVTGEGIDALLARVRDTLTNKGRAPGLVAHRRQAECIETALGYLSDLPYAHEMVIQKAQDATYALERLIGRVDAEDYLDVIFSRFCIGK